MLPPTIRCLTTRNIGFVAHRRLASAITFIPTSLEYEPEVKLPSRLGMDPRFAATRDDLYNVQMEVKQLQVTQHSHAERLMRVEKRLAEDAAVKSVWATPQFPSALSGTPQHGPLQISHADVFDDFDEHGQNLLGSLHLDAEDEPVRRGAASRANSVRFDESALQASGWGQSTRQAGDFAPIRPTSGFGMMERSLSHKSDGRHSSAGHSVHSVHSVASGRGSSLGHLDTNSVFGAREEDSPVEIPEPPPGLFVLGSVPAIVRCWLTENFAHNTLLYADVCSGAQRSTLDYSLAKELDLLSDIHKGADGISRLTLTVYLAEAIVSQSNSTRSPGPVPHIPNMTVNFEITGLDVPESPESKKSIRIFIGTDALRAHSADLLFSQNLMTLYSSNRDKLSVPFVRPEDDSLFRFLTTVNIVPEKPKLNASAPEFVLGNGAKSSPPRQPAATVNQQPAGKDSKSQDGLHGQRSMSPLALPPYQQQRDVTGSSTHSESGAESEQPSTKGRSTSSGKDEPSLSSSDTNHNTRRSTTESTPGIWGSWRQGAAAVNGSGGDGAAAQRGENGLSGYQPAGRSRMKVLKPSKSAAGGGNTTSSSTRTGQSYEPPPQTSSRSSGEHRRKSAAAAAASGATSATENTSMTSSTHTVRWEKRSISGSISSFKDGKLGGAVNSESRSSSATLPRSANPVGGASAFSWMTPAPKPKTPAVGE